ncbi:thiosulfate:glutathione sulfurtransferase [Eucyclogobius newberryi]|uniref:thiosulfate:glutathione sulfurtransferase n=1 Tax=Eucyclogobius newberryi TaxID=166745 RepID=UPI003B59D44D
MTPRTVYTVLMMLLTHAFSRSFCQVLTEINRRSYPTLSSCLRTSATVPPGCADTDNDVVTVSQLKSMLTSKNVQLFDVRGSDEYLAGHIPSAVNMPLSDLEVSLKLSSETFEQKFQVKAPAKEDDNIVFNCRSGVRSGQALDIARQLGYSKARHLQGGFSEWEAEETK